MTDDYLTLTTFVPGTKAKADEVNANFSALKEAISAKAAMNGDSTQTFSVADAIADSHAVNKSQLQDLSNDLVAEINKTGIRFCVKSGNTSNGQGCLFTNNVLEITPLIAGTYANLVIVDYTGTQTTISTTPSSLDLTGCSDGTYNIFITPAGVLYILNNTIYKQPKRPTMMVNDVWLNTSEEPFKCIKYAGSTDTKFLDVPLGKVIIKSGAITLLETFKFNQNGYSINSNTTLDNDTALVASIPHFVMPDYTSGVTKSFSTVYKADSDGFLYFTSRTNGYFYVSTGNADSDSANYSWITLTVNSFGDQGYISSVFIPIPKGFYYKIVVGNASGASLTFFPSLGV